MVHEILIIANSVIGKSALPDFPLATENRAAGVRESALGQWNGMLNGYFARGRHKKMNVFRHQHACVNLKPTFAPIPIYGYKKKPRIIFNHEQFAPLPGRERYEVSSGRRDESSRFQKQTSAAKAASFA
jgi:hypothetical protein